MSRSECIRQEENKITVVTPNFVWEAFKRNLIPDPCCDNKPPTELSSAVAAHRIASDYVEKNIRGLGIKRIQGIQALVARPDSAAAAAAAAAEEGGADEHFTPPLPARAAGGASAALSSFAAPARAPISRSAIENFLERLHSIIRDDTVLVEHLGTMYLFGAHNLYNTLQRIIEDLEPRSAASSSSSSSGARGGASLAAAAYAASIGGIPPAAARKAPPSQSAIFPLFSTFPGGGGGGGRGSPNFVDEGGDTIDPVTFLTSGPNTLSKNQKAYIRFYNLSEGARRSYATPSESDKPTEKQQEAIRHILKYNQASYDRIFQGGGYRKSRKRSKAKRRSTHKG